jgi:hypothetical protein
MNWRRWHPLERRTEPKQSLSCYSLNLLTALKVSPGAEKWFNTRSRLKAGSRTISLCSHFAATIISCALLIKARQGATLSVLVF